MFRTCVGLLPPEAARKPMKNCNPRAPTRTPAKITTGTQSRIRRNQARYLRPRRKT
jgi:hypothetical protein